MNLRLLYLYLFSFVGLLIVIFGSIQMVNLGLKTFVFSDIDTYESFPVTDPSGKYIESKEEIMERQKRESKRQRQRDFVYSFSMLAVGTPVYLYHWRLIKKENRKG